MGPCRLRLSDMPLCSDLLLGIGLGRVGLCWGPLVLFRMGLGWLGFAKGTLVGCPGWCGSVLIRNMIEPCI